MGAYVLYIVKNGNRSYLGKNTETGEFGWISEWIVSKPMSDLFPLVYKRREYAEDTALKIGVELHEDVAVLELKANN